MSDAIARITSEYRAACILIITIALRRRRQRHLPQELWKYIFNLFAIENINFDAVNQPDIIYQMAKELDAPIFKYMIMSHGSKINLNIENRNFERPSAYVCNYQPAENIKLCIERGMKPYSICRSTPGYDETTLEVIIMRYHCDDINFVKYFIDKVRDTTTDYKWVVSLMFRIGNINPFLTYEIRDYLTKE